MRTRRQYSGVSTTGKNLTATANPSVTAASVPVRRRSATAEMTSSSTPRISMWPL
jgi:hypothetical protein